MTNEARVLRLLRKEHGLTLAAVAASVGVTDSLIAQYEAGRMNPPKGDRLEKLLTVYGKIKQKSFYERVRKYEERLTPQDEAVQLLGRMEDSQILMVLPILKGLLKN